VRLVGRVRDAVDPVDGPLADVVDEGRRITAAAVAAEVPLRLLGGVAVCVHAAAGIHPALARTYGDIDLVTTKRGGRDTLRLLEGLGYVQNERFNALNGAERLVVYDMGHARQIDVFVGKFSMCHALPISDRLDRDDQTVPLAELLLTKLQIVQLNAKDVADVHALVLDHDVGDSDTEMINGSFIAALLAGDWGLWRTVQGSIATAKERLAGAALAQVERDLIADRLDRLWARIEAEPKSVRWKTRARLGDRIRWYAEPDEIAHQQPQASV
jgi:hypothetical protein